jgi:phage gpG-like protein
MFRLQFRVVNAPAFDRALDGLAGSVRDLRPFADDIIENGMRPVLAEQFASSGATGASGPWAALSPGYLEAKARRWGEQQIEVASGRMRASLLHDTADTVKNVSERTIEFGTSVEYALYQQTGFKTRLGTGKARRYKPKPDGLPDVPARRLFDWTREQQDDIMKAFQRSLMGYLTRLGYRILGPEATAGEARHAGAIASRLGYEGRYSGGA